jgi:hypothetical protein
MFSIILGNIQYWPGHLSFRFTICSKVFFIEFGRGIIIWYVYNDEVGNLIRIYERISLHSVS